MEMSIAVMISSTHFWKRAASNWLSAPRNVRRLSEARLQELLSRCMYSEQGLDAEIRPDAGQVCQSLIVPSYWMPGSAHSHAACEMPRNSFLASTVSMTSPVMRARSPNVSPDSTARMNSSVTRTELFAFWYCTEAMSEPPRSMSN